MATNDTTRCFDCGGLWKRREHQTWCRHHRAPKTHEAGAVAPYGAAMDIGGFERVNPTGGPLPAVGFGRAWKDEVVR